MTLSLQEYVEEILAGPDPAPIVQAGHPVLRRVAATWTGQLEPGTFADLIELMRRTMRAAPGVGLAAPQIGIPLAVAVIEDPGGLDPDLVAVRERAPLEFRVLVNPRYESACAEAAPGPVAGETVTVQAVPAGPVPAELASFYEGCLSLAGWQAVVTRYRSVRLTGQDETGRPLDEVLTGWPARIVQHETDHLGGTLYIDRAELRSLTADPGFGAAFGAEPSPSTAVRLLGFELPRTARAARPELDSPH